MNSLAAQKPAAILFDWDNTLADTWPVIHASLNRTFSHFGLPEWSIQDVKNGRNGIHRSLRNSFPELFGDTWEEARDIYYHHFKTIHLEYLSVLPHAEDMLKRCKQAGCYMAIVSNKTGVHLRSEVAHLGWGHYFSTIVGATDAAEDKPSAAPVHLALKGSGLTPSEDIWFMGDSATDVECAFNSGCLPVTFGADEIPRNTLTKETQAYLDRIQNRLYHFTSHQETIVCMEHWV